jgi:hypothetical protein
VPRRGYACCPHRWFPRRDERSTESVDITDPLVFEGVKPPCVFTQVTVAPPPSDPTITRSFRATGAQPIVACADRRETHSQPVAREDRVDLIGGDPACPAVSGHHRRRRRGCVVIGNWRHEAITEHRQRAFKSTHGRARPDPASANDGSCYTTEVKTSPQVRCVTRPVSAPMSCGRVFALQCRGEDRLWTCLDPGSESRCAA